MAENALICRNASCEVKRTGICALGNDPVDSCPEYDPEQAELDTGEEESSQIVGDDEPQVAIRSSEALTEGELESFRMANRSIVVSLVGDVKAGKTTLVTALYAQFCKGSFAGYSFESSRTLAGFARRHHLSLLKSGSEKPITPRTSIANGVGFYHLNLQADSVRSVHLIVADRSGEAFQAARIDTSLVEGLRELRLADRACFLLDADKLTDPGTRANYRREFKQTIWALLQNNAFSSKVVLEVLATKIDKLSRPGSEAKVAREELREFEDGLIKEFGAEGYHISAFEICALPSANYKIGLVGVEELLARWLNPPSRTDICPLRPDRSARAIDRLVEFWDGE